MPDQTKKFKIVYLIARFHPFKGGAENYIWELAKLSAAQGHQVTVLTTNISPTGEVLPKEETISGINIRRFRTWNHQLNLGFYPGLLPALLKVHADAIHVGNGPGFLWHEFCLFWKRLFSRRTVFMVSPHGRFLATPETHTGWKRAVSGVAKVLMYPYFRLLWPFLFDVVFADNPKQPQWLSQDYGMRNIVMLPICISVEQLLTSTDIETKLQALKSQEVVISCIGRIAKYKGFQYVVQALSNLNKSEKLTAPFKLFIMGKPERYIENLRQLIANSGISDKIELIERPSDEVKNDILINKSQIHILPSHFEATGIVLLEAMAKGNAIITSDGNEAAEQLITNGENGFIFRNQDVDDLADKLTTIINDSDLRWQMVQRNLEKVKTFTWEAIFPNYINTIYQYDRQNR